MKRQRKERRNERKGRKIGEEEEEEGGEGKGRRREGKGSVPFEHVQQEGGKDTSSGGKNAGETFARGRKVVTGAGRPRLLNVQVSLYGLGRGV
ncbi:hypothetical protein E2C01_092886 [Portunus trituberculatus]|uniref:Uncharacterized protein n=1 Tax=Portunus trituberculatus TaxID=210409 RepID=A0A5B7JTE2_PORTR|nr:hypothetical protein [Portunus trituberculatus]